MAPLKAYESSNEVVIPILFVAISILAVLLKCICGKAERDDNPQPQESGEKDNQEPKNAVGHIKKAETKHPTGKDGSKKVAAAVQGETKPDTPGKDVSRKVTAAETESFTTGGPSVAHMITLGPQTEKQEPKPKPDQQKLKLAGTAPNPKPLLGAKERKQSK